MATQVCNIFLRMQRVYDTFSLVSANAGDAGNANSVVGYQNVVKGQFNVIRGSDGEGGISDIKRHVFKASGV